jgi:hypothetical protein
MTSRCLIRLVAIVAIVLFLKTSAAVSEEGQKELNESQRRFMLLARTGWDGEFTYRHLQGIFSRDRWVLLDAGYIDFGSATEYRELWVGGGAVVHRSERPLVIFEAFIAKAFGSHALGEIYLQPWVLLQYRVSDRIASELVLFQYVPLNHHGIRQYVLDRLKLEYDLQRWRLGVGYAGQKIGSEDWKHCPFLTTSFNVYEASSLEFWLQRLPDDRKGSRVQGQIRYTLALNW